MTLKEILESVKGNDEENQKAVVEYLEKIRKTSMTVQELIDILEKVKDKNVFLALNLVEPEEQIFRHEWWHFDVECTITQDNKHALVTFSPTMYEGS